MTVIAAVTVAADEFELGRVFAGTDRSVELARIAPLGGDFTPCVWVDDVGDSDGFVESVESYPSVDRFVRLGGGVDRHRYRVEWASATGDGATLFAPLRAHDVLVERGVTRTARMWLFRLRMDDRDTLTALRRTCADAGITIDVRRVVHNPGTIDCFDLTEKQRDALVVAFDEGYFDIPSETTLTTLAEQFDISRQAYTRRLQRALYTCLVNMGIGDLDR